MSKGNIALLDFDGYICKAYYASMSKGEDDFESMVSILENLVYSAISKMPKENTDVFIYMSGHTYKKDIYPSYKANRKKDEGLGAFRDYIKILYDNEIIIDNLLEADDKLIMAYEHWEAMGYNVVCFSDDKDLRHYCKNYCKININEELVQQDKNQMIVNRIVQFVAGDREDNIIGIYGLGEKKAQAELNKLGGVSIDNVIRLYRNKGINIDECLKNIILISPLHSTVVEDYDWIEPDTMKTILGHFKYWNRKVKEIYDETV